MKKFKLSEDAQKGILFVLMCISLALLVFCGAIVTGCTRPVSAQETVSKRDIIVLKYKVDKQDKIIRAYNHLLHQVWLDKPTYVEECLVESDAFCELDELLGDWGDTFQFYNQEDSIAYELNWDKEGPGCIRVVKHIVINEPAKGRIRGMFGND